MGGGNFNDTVPFFLRLDQEFAANKSAAFAFQFRNGIDDLFTNQFETTINVANPEAKKEKNDRLPGKSVQLPHRSNLAFTVVANDQIGSGLVLGGDKLIDFGEVKLAVGVDKGNPGVFGGIKPALEGGTVTAVDWVINDPDVLVFGGKYFRHLPGIIF